MLLRFLFGCTLNDLIMALNRSECERKEMILLGVLLVLFDPTLVLLDLCIDCTINLGNGTSSVKCTVSLQIL